MTLGRIREERMAAKSDREKKEMKTRHILTLCWAGLLLGASGTATLADMAQPTAVPDPPTFKGQSKVKLLDVTEFYEYKALPAYHEPDWVTKNYVDTGKLPPLKDRLPPQPLIFKTAGMPDGVGVYGDALRQVGGDVPQGFNFYAGENAGYGGVETGMMECLTRTGPLFQVKHDEVAPLPNLATSWEWSADGHQLTMHLIKGVKWSDGVPFTSADVMFQWDYNIQDSNIVPEDGTSPITFGAHTTLKALDDYTLLWTFAETKPDSALYSMAFGSMCPLPAHILKPQHPAFSKNTYEQYKNAFPPQTVNFPTLGPWTPYYYKRDELQVFRRNPYFWKVDENGNQLPYISEIQYKITTWDDRTVQAVAGTGDWSNMEEPDNFVEALKKAADPKAPARLEFGPRNIGYSLELNYGTEGWAAPDANRLAVRKLNRNLDFRKAVSMALDRQLLGNSLVKGPFTAIYPGGLYPDTPYYDKASTVYFPYSVETAKAYLAKAGLKDTDGDGFVNFPAADGGADVQIRLLSSTDEAPDRTMAEGVIAQMEKIGLKIVSDPSDDVQTMSRRDAGDFDWTVRRVEREFNTVIQDLARLAPIGPRTSYFHKAGPDGKLDLMPFEQDLVGYITAFSTADAKERVELMKKYQKTFTENLYSIGLTVYPGALIVNKRIRNIPAGTPILEYQWAEESVGRERMFVPKDLQKDYELFPGKLSGGL